MLIANSVGERLFCTRHATLEDHMSPHRCQKKSFRRSDSAPEQHPERRAAAPPPPPQLQRLPGDDGAQSLAAALAELTKLKVLEARLYQNNIGAGPQGRRGAGALNPTESETCPVTSKLFQLEKKCV